MRTFKNNDELKALIVDGSINIDDDIHCLFDIDVNADIYALNITARNIDANDITARNIYAHNINANDINANDVNYYAFCVAYQTFKCKSIKGIRKNSVHFCLDSDIEMKNSTRTITIDGKVIEISEESFQAFKEQFNK